MLIKGRSYFCSREFNLKYPRLALNKHSYTQFNNRMSEGQSSNEEKKGASTRVKETEGGKEKGKERRGEGGRERQQISF